jgi:SAM-dependent methyltransferase
LKTNIEKSIKYIKDHGFVSFLMKVREKTKKTMQKQKSNRDSKSIWDDSLRQYEKDNFKLYWETLPEVSRYQNKCMTGDENVYGLTFAFNYVKENIGSNNLRGLSIGCNEGGPEAIFFQSGIFNNIEIMDIAEGLLDKQRKIAKEKGLDGIHYIHQDCNKLTLEEKVYHFIWSVGTIHHIEHLEVLFEQINKALKDNGVFVIREYVGQNRLQFTDEQLSIVNEILSALPEKFKKNSDGAIKYLMSPPKVEDLLKQDPSESVRSQDILPLIKEKFEVITLAYTGGTILYPLLEGIASNFEKDEDAETVLRLLILFERILIEKKILPSDYVFCMAKKKTIN